MACKSAPRTISNHNFYMHKFKIRWLDVAYCFSTVENAIVPAKLPTLNREGIPEKTYFSPSRSLQASFQTHSDHDVL